MLKKTSMKGCSSTFPGFTKDTGVKSCLLPSLLMTRCATNRILSSNALPFWMCCAFVSINWSSRNSPGGSKQAYRTFYRIINTGSNIPPQVELRVFTFSKEPIAVRNTEVKELNNLAPPYIANRNSGGKEGVPIYRKVFESNGWVVYENENCLPRAFTVSNLKIADDIKDVRRQFELFEFNPAETALVSHEDMARIGRTSFAKGMAKIEKYDTDCIVINAEFQDGPGFLVLADQYFPSWKAFVDGQETPIYQVDGLLRGVVVSAPGRHAVEFKYRPEKFYAAGVVGVLAFLGTLVLAFRSK